jgi:hypothetical protein
MSKEVIRRPGMKGQKLLEQNKCSILIMGTTGYWMTHKILERSSNSLSFKGKGVET